MVLKAASGPQSSDTFFIDIFFKEKKKNDLKKVSLYPLRVSSFKFRAYFH